jgi:type IV pilus assembly protein PilX
MKCRQLRGTSPRRQQEGIILIVAIIAIVAMTFAVYAMLRSTTGNLGIAGNLAFKKNATSASDFGVEQARAWLVTPPQTNNTLAADNAAGGYFSTWNDTFDPFTYSWTVGTNAVEATADDGSGNRVRYVIHRLCKLTGSVNLPAQECVRPSSLSGGSVIGTGGGVAGVSVSPALPASYFRITTRVDGPRNTLSYTQVIVY